MGNRKGNQSNCMQAWKESWLACLYAESPNCRLRWFVSQTLLLVITTGSWGRDSRELKEKVVVGCWLCGWESDSRDTDLKGRNHEQQRGQWGAAPPDPPCGTVICRGLPEVLQPLRQVPPDPSHAGSSRSRSFAPRTVRGKTGCKRQLGLGMMKGCWAFDRTVLLAAGHVVMRKTQTTTWCPAYSNFFFERGLLHVDTSPPQAVLSTVWMNLR